MKAFVLAVVLLTLGSAPWGAERAGAQGVDSCLKFEFPNRYFDTVRWETYMNDDSVEIDSCPGSTTYLEYYATKGWGIDFAYYVIHREPAPYDTTIELSWTAIDTAYSALRAAFSALETKFGTFHLGEERPDSYDSTAPGSRTYGLRFDNYICVDSVIAMLKSLPDLDSTDGFVDAGFSGYPAWADGPPSGVAEPKMIFGGLSVNPNPVHSNVSIQRSDGQSIRHILVLDMLGKPVFTKNYRGLNEITIDVRSLASGTYLILCDNRFESQIVIER